MPGYTKVPTSTLLPTLTNTPTVMPSSTPIPIKQPGPPTDNRSKLQATPQLLPEAGGEKSFDTLSLVVAVLIGGIWLLGALIGIEGSKFLYRHIWRLVKFEDATLTVEYSNGRFVAIIKDGGFELISETGARPFEMMKRLDKQAEEYLNWLENTEKSGTP